MSSPTPSSSARPSTCPIDTPAAATSSSSGQECDGDSVDLTTLLSPSAHTHHCAQRLFSEDADDEDGDRGRLHELGGEREAEDEDRDEEEEAEEVKAEDDDKVMGRDEVREEVVEDEEEEDRFEDALESVNSPPARSASLEKTDDDEESPLTSDPAWRSRSKHFFVLSRAGKPIYSLHGDEDRLASTTALMQALVSYAEDDMGDPLHGVVVSNGCRIAFLDRKPLILVAVARDGSRESHRQLVTQLTYLYYQLVSVLTLSQMSRIFEQRQGFDLRRMIAGSERLLASLCDAMDSDPSFFLSAVKVLPMPQAAREAVSSAVVSACAPPKKSTASAPPPPPVVFALVIAAGHLVTLVHMKKYLLAPSDLHVILNLVGSTESFRHSETWIPLCLPKFDSSGFMHAHVSYLSEEACLVLLTVERDAFFELAKFRQKIMDSLEASDSLAAVAAAVAARRSAADQTTSGAPSDIRHFLYKAKAASQFACPGSAASGPYGLDEAARRRLHGLYLRAHERLHCRTRPLKLLFLSASRETVVAWATQTFELYAAFSPLVSKSAIIEALNRLLKWCKREENTLFILNGPTF